MIVVDWQARHGLTAKSYQQQFDQLVSQGYRLVKVTGYAINNEARFVGIWQLRGGNAWHARHGIPVNIYERTGTTLAQEGCRPTHHRVVIRGSHLCTG